MLILSIVPIQFDADRGFTNKTRFKISEGEEGDFEDTLLGTRWAVDDVVSFRDERKKRMKVQTNGLRRAITREYTT
jgi:hypothetical protein